MPKRIMTCRVCGKSYEACKTLNTTGQFRWRDVACSPECGQAYLVKITGIGNEGEVTSSELNRNVVSNETEEITSNCAHNYSDDVETE